MRTTIRKIGNSAGVILPAAIREKLHLNEGDSVEIDVQGGQIVIKPCKVKPKYKLSELVAQCDENAPYPDKLREWDEAPAVGQEAL
ncbi:AbrB/MazE/SpoVT family DNA-binding domain-containing protein [Nitrincola alkalilacustris]|uniref:AbrB/MazE/SpoVT family DNA-binding domain-containing protein n=1 Tax=Nitrincola alkalilacustris TaxID=1571224 RepID=UPI00124D2249|nr:AbrB/MazE/SpoVT family DNA-binding domain-containing protein [Nitrincola alkalilacustris]